MLTMLPRSGRDYFYNYCIILRSFLLGVQVSDTPCSFASPSCHGRVKAPHERVYRCILCPFYPSGACCVRVFPTSSPPNVFC